MKRNYLIALGLFLALTPALHAGQAKADADAKHAKMLAKFDVNHNGVLDPDEKAALAKFKADLIAKYDKNGDGKLDDAEREAAKADMKAKHSHGAAAPAKE